MTRHALHPGLAFVAAVAFVAASPAAPRAAAAPPVAVAKSPSVDEIVTGYVNAVGGLQKIHSIQSLREKGRIITGPNRVAIAVRERKRPDHTRFEFTVQGVTSVYVSDGKRAWRMSPLDGDTAPTPLPDQVVIEAAEQGDLEGPLVDWKAKGHHVELAGREKVGDRDAWKLKVTLKSGATRYEYIDVQSRYRLKTESTRTLHGVPTAITTTFDRFEKTDGVSFPRLIMVNAAGRPQTLRVEIDQIDVNPPLSDARFTMTAEP